MKKGVFPFINPDFKKWKIRFSHGKKPYLKNIGKISGFAVWQVDGKYVRENICEDFVNMGQHMLFKFMPKNEFWIAKEANSGEKNFYEHHLLIENRLMKKGLSYDRAWLVAAAAEKRERMKSKLAKKLEKIKSRKKIVFSNIHKKLLKNGNFKIWLVNGEAVRDEFRIDFAGGGHSKVYRFIPEDEIWIDDDISPNERRFIIIHELEERKLMSRGRKYHDAHFIATEIEDIARKNPKRVNVILDKLIE